MSKGPEQLKFEQAVDAAHPDDLTTAAGDWYLAEYALRQTAVKLREKAGPARSVSEQTGPRMSEAFLRSAEAMERKADKLREGKAALEDAATRLRAAKDDRAKLRPLDAPGAYGGPTDPKTPEEVRAKAAHDSAVDTYERNRRFNEELARGHNQQMDAQNRTSTAVMKSIHGEPDRIPEAPGPGGGDGGTGGAGTAGATGAGSGGTAAGGSAVAVGSGGGSSPGGSGSEVLVGSGTGPGAGPGSAGGHANGDSSGDDTVGTPQGGTATGSPATTSGATAGAAAGGAASGGTVGGNLGGVAAAAGGGALAGAGGILGGARGGAVPPASGGSGGSRPIGSTSRSGGAGTLGRSPGGAAAGSAARPGAGAPGAGRAGRGAGAAGGRGTGGRVGATGAGRVGRGKDRDRSRKADTLVDEQDWIDDEGASPQTLD